jgi:GTP-binding protein YchF
VKLGLIGLAGSGKTALFDCLTHGAGRTKARLSGVGLSMSSVPVPDPRLEHLAKITSPAKCVSALVEIYDFPAPSEPAASQVLAAAREIDCLLLVLRDFENRSYPHPAGSIDPARDADELRTLFLLADLLVIEKRIEKLKVMVTKPTDLQDQQKKELAILEAFLGRVETGEDLCRVEVAPEDEPLLAGYRFLSRKPMLPVRNVSEDRAADSHDALSLCGCLEAEILELEEDEQAEFLADLGLTELSAGRIIEGAYRALNLVTFYTVVSDELRAWAVPQGTSAPQAAGKIHTDMERGFIRAEVASWEEMAHLASPPPKSLFRLEGKKYVIRDGDVVTFRFSV